MNYRPCWLRYLENVSVRLGMHRLWSRKTCDRGLEDSKRSCIPSQRWSRPDVGWGHTAPLVTMHRYRLWSTESCRWRKGCLIWFSASTCKSWGLKPQSKSSTQCWVSIIIFCWRHSGPMTPVNSGRHTTLPKPSTHWPRLCSINLFLSSFRVQVRNRELKTRG